MRKRLFLSMTVMILMAVPFLLGASDNPKLQDIYDIVIQIYEKINSIESIEVAKTGQVISYEPRDDGDLQVGKTWPNPRFTDNGDGTVTDNLTNLIWLKDASCIGAFEWSTALTECYDLTDGECNLNDGSGVGDWRLPNEKELLSLVDFSNYLPALPNAHPFSGVQSSNYWSSTTWTNGIDSAWYVGMYAGYVGNTWKNRIYYVWPVRSDN